MNKKKKIKWDFEPESKEAKKVLKSLEDFIKKGYGKRCEMRACKCPVCEIWALYDLVKTMLH